MSLISFSYISSQEVSSNSTLMPVASVNPGTMLLSINCEGAVRSETPLMVTPWYGSPAWANHSSGVWAYAGVAIGRVVPKITTTIVRKASFLNIFLASY